MTERMMELPDYHYESERSQMTFTEIWEQVSKLGKYEIVQPERHGVVKSPILDKHFKEVRFIEPHFIVDSLGHLHVPRERGIGIDMQGFGQFIRRKR